MPAPGGWLTDYRRRYRTLIAEAMVTPQILTEWVALGIEASPAMSATWKASWSC